MGSKSRTYLKMYQILATFRTWDVDNPYGYVILYDEMTEEKMAVKSDMVYPYLYGGMIVECNLKEINETIEANTKNASELQSAKAILEGATHDPVAEAIRKNESEADPGKLPNPIIVPSVIV